MGANATTKVPSYVAGQVLTAADLSITNSGIPVFANATDRTNSFGGTGEKTLAEGQYAYLESDDKTYVYDGSAWKEVGAGSGLVLIKSQTIGSAVSSVAVTGVFSSTYDNYLILLTGGTGSTAAGLNMTLGATATGYYFGGANSAYGSASVASSRGSNATSWPFGGSSSLGMVGAATLLGPNLAARTFINTQYGFPDTGDSGNYASGFLNNATQYTDFTLTPGSGTITGGTIRVYGYANS